MPVRLGIELSPVACRIVELDAPGRPGRDGPTTRVRSFARMPRDGTETNRRLSSLGRRAAAVVVWGLQADHRQAVVEHGSFRTMRRAAVTAIGNAGVETRGRVADIAPAPRRGRDAATRAVIVALAPTRDLAIALRWLTGEGVRVQTIVTPALALMSLARLRRDAAARGLPGTLDVYVALEESATAVALVRDGALVAACELEWGYQDAQRETRARGEIATRLADEIERFLAACGARPNAVSQIFLCGGLPELRSMALALMQQLDVEVETLDSLFAIDASRLPNPADRFRDDIAELRLAWAVAADWPAPINLLRERQRRQTKTLLTRAAVVAGVVTGVGVAWQIQRDDRWRSPAVNPRPATTRAANPAAPAASGAPVRTPPAARPTVPPAAPPVERQAVARPAQPPPVTPPAMNQREQAPRRRTAAAQPATPLPFDAALGSILYAPDRKLAIVDGRIVQVGDDVRGAQVVDITPASVLLRDEQGRVRSLTLGALGR